ncbi:MAG: DNA alkylation repair protein [Saprospiraceae bacterium]
MITPDQYLQIVKTRFQEVGHPEVAEGQRKYMRNLFEYYGLKAPEWLAIAKTLFQEHGVFKGEALTSFVRLCMADEYREINYFGIEMMQQVLKKQPADFIDFLEELILTKSWWDSVDWLAKLAGIHFLRYPDLIKPVTEKWMNSNNIWLQRTALIFQLLYKEKTNVPLLFGYIQRLAHSPEFFIQKGAGWALRQLTRREPEMVIEFVKTNNLAPLTKREALKWLQKQGRL